LLLCVIVFVSVGAFEQGKNVTNDGIYGTWYCSLTNPSQYGSCNPGACGFNVGPNMGYGIAALNPKYYDGGSACQYKGSGCHKCWKVSGPAGTVKVIISDCCAGYPGHCSCLQCPSEPSCDWCASGDHWHFDFDRDSFVGLCGQSGIQAGHCQLSNAVEVGC